MHFGSLSPVPGSPFMQIYNGRIPQNLYSSNEWYIICNITSAKNRARVTELDAFLEDTQNGGHQTHRHKGVDSSS